LSQLVEWQLHNATHFISQFAGVAPIEHGLADSRVARGEHDGYLIAEANSVVAAA